MATRSNLDALIDRSDKAPREGGSWQPEDGMKYSLKVGKVTSKVSKKTGLPGFNVTYEVLKSDDPDDVSRRGRTYMGFSDEHDFITQRTIDSMKAMGVPPKTLKTAQRQKGADIICEMISGKTIVGLAELSGEDDKGRPYVNWEFEAPRGRKAKKTKVQEVPDPEDEDEEFEDHEDDEEFDDDGEEFDDLDDDDDDDEVEEGD